MVKLGVSDEYPRRAIIYIDSLVAEGLMKEFVGKVVRVVDDMGLVFVVVERGIDRLSFIATFDKIEGYRGEHAEELNVKKRALEHAF